MKKFKIAVFASGNGSNAEAIFNHFKNHSQVEVSLLITNNPNAFALERARKYEIESKVFLRTEFNQEETVLEYLRQKGITHIVLAGFLWLIPAWLIKAYPDHIINIHPALLPLFGGKGMYGFKVHEAVKASGKLETGITIHLVNEHYDEGRILFQDRCYLTVDHTPEEIAGFVHQLEHRHYPRVIEEWILHQA